MKFDITILIDVYQCKNYCQRSRVDDASKHGIWKFDHYRRFKPF